MVPGLTSGGKVAEGQNHDETELLDMTLHTQSVTGNCCLFMFI